jgi:tetratricopeptide (TPR) repeat protein
MFLAAFLILSQAAPATADKTRLDACLKQAATAPAAAEGEANRWRSQGGGFRADQCLATAYANQQHWQQAAATFEAAARTAAAAHDVATANLWALAGSAWLAAGDNGKAQAALDTAIDTGPLLGSDLGEAHLDRARARVAAGDLSGAREDLDLATVSVPDDPVAWLLSATLARRMNDIPRAAKDVREALQRAPEDPAVHLEAGNIAARAGDEVAARASWSRVVELAPGSPIAGSARKALEQFGGDR